MKRNCVTDFDAADERRDQDQIADRQGDEKRQAEPEPALEEEIVGALPNAEDSGAIGIAVDGKDVLEGAEPRAENPIVFDRGDRRRKGAPAPVFASLFLHAVDRASGE